MGAYRDYISEDADMQTMIFRYSVLVDVFGARLPNELRCENKLSDELKKKILRKPYTEQIDRLVFLYGTGVISEEALKTLVLHNDSDFLSDVLELENEVRKNEGADETDILSYEQLQKIMLLCANSKKYDDLSAVGFNEVLEIISSSHIYVTDGGFIRCDKELTEFLNDLGEPFGYYDTDDDVMQLEEPQYISAAAADNYDILSDKSPIAFDCTHIRYYLKVYDKLYGKDFIEYAAENGLPFDEDYFNEYEKYLSNIKLCFDFKAYPRKREICGDKVNHYDYAVNNIEENKLINSELNAADDYSVSIRLDVDEPLRDSELTEKALKKYRSSRQLIDEMVIEVIHAGKKDMYIYKNGDISAVDVAEFHRQLFDFNKIWGIIQMCSREKKIKRVGDVITLPQEFIDEIAPDQREYANNMVKEQYKLLVQKRQENKHMQTLNDIRAAASANMKKIAEEKAEKAAEKAAKLAARNQGLTKINKNENGGN
ncbi:MAG: hypothetical protein NC253_00745 [Ruminococcus sp.]|nr:hypothetical protein [Ruminococcus sp.]MCM1381061.1 hypothetical protein [Muribaculaceae bacterium]MCM1478572.1 hypothetical protein [Muribaculaceae bacterium]